MNIRIKRIVRANYGVAAMIMIAAIIMLIKSLSVGENFPTAKNVWFLAAMFTAMIGGVVAIFSLHISAIWRNMYWLASLASKERTSKINSDTQIEHDKKWPWGSHHTEMLGHLEAAAKTFWIRYDPTDPSTAPTNEMVSRWLRDERGVSKEKANAIASILRVDGLRTGPR